MQCVLHFSVFLVICLHFAGANIARYTQRLEVYVGCLMRDDRRLTVVLTAGRRSLDLLQKMEQ